MRPCTPIQPTPMEIAFRGFESVDYNGGVDRHRMRARFEVFGERGSPFTVLAEFLVGAGFVVDIQANDEVGLRATAGTTGRPDLDRAIQEAVTVEKIRAEAAAVWILHTRATA